MLAKLDAPETRAIVEQPVTKSKAAQARANSARAAGDLRHATELDALALTWAQVADDLVRTAAAEKQLAELQKSVADLEQKAVRTQALIEQTIARRARAEQNLKSLPKPSAPTPNALTTAPKAAAGASHPGPKPSAPAGKK